MPTKLQAALAELNGVPAQTRIEVIRGVTVRRKKNGLTVMSLHYSAVPERDPETFAGEKWYAENSSRYSSMARWKKEQEMDPYATGGEAVFGSVLGNPALYEIVVISDPHWYPGPPYMAANPDVVAGFDHGVTNATCLLKGYVPKKSFDPKTGREKPLELYVAGEFYRYRSDEWQNNVDENVKVMKKMPDMERARWIKADPSIFYDAVAQDKGAPTNIYQTYKKNNMWKMTPYDGVRSDVTFVEWVMADWWRGISTLEGKPTGQKPRLYIVCRTPSDRPQPGLHEFDCPNLLWEMKRAKRVQMTSRQLLTRNPSEALENKNNHAMDPLKQILGTLRNPAAIDPNEAIAAAIEHLDPFAAQLTSRWTMSKLAREGMLGPDGKARPNGKSAPRIDLRRAPGVLGRR
jgi:hypothetical protein